MTMHDERYIISISDDHNTVHLRDQKIGYARIFTGAKAFYDALGILAEWRERDQARGTDTPSVIIDGDGDKWVRRDDGWYAFCGALPLLETTIEYIREFYGIRETQ